MRKTAFIAALLLGTACTGKKGVNQFSWLEGKWKGHDAIYDFTETWNKRSDNLMSCYLVVMQNADTMYKGGSKIEIIGDEPCYVVNIPEFSDPVIFKLTHSDEKEFVFENTEHEFPQRISYKMTGDSLQVRQEGKREGQNAREEIYYHRK